MREKILFIYYFIISHYILISFTQQIPFVSNSNYYQRQGILDFSPPPSTQCQHTQTNTKVFKLKHILHHGTTPSNRHLFRQLNINDIEKDPLHPTAITFNEHVINSINVDGSEGTGEMNVKNLQVKEVPNAKDKTTVLSMAKMSYDAYIELEPLKDHWIDLEDWDTIPFGWEKDGVRGYVFSDSENKTIIVAIKGTSLSYLPYGGGPISKNDKFNDNLMFSCCCAKIDITWKGVCGCYKSGWNCDNTCLHKESNVEGSYFISAKIIYEKVKKDFPDSDIWLTGHSLGGSLASLLALNNSLPAFTYQTPGELLYAKRLGLITHDSHKLPIYHFGHTADPIFMGVCNGRSSICYHWGFAMETKCHTGLSCVYDTKSKLGWKSDIRSHVVLMRKIVKIVNIGISYNKGLSPSLVLIF
ncbi:unnamed protein product [Rhizophagus irregularis]|nr:unnamed protein product [Rhizophagus irregularis]